MVRGIRHAAIWLVALGAFALPAAAQLPRNVGVSLEQCANAPSGIGDCTGAAWVSGNLNSSKSLYREGDFVPFRVWITGLTAGTTYTLRIGYDAVENGLHAYDYLGSVDGSENYPTQQVVPCENLSGTAGPHACGSDPSVWPVPLDVNTTFPRGGQVEGEFSAWGGVLTGAAYVSPTPIVVGTAGTVERQVDVTFRAEGGAVVLAWGGHIASSLDWGTGNTFVGNHGGSPFHMRVLPSDTIQTGHQDLSVQGDVIAPLPSPFETTVTPGSVEVGETVVDEATLAADASGTVSFYVCFDATATPDCRSGGIAVGLENVIANPVAGGPGSALNDYEPDEAGHYCFRAEYRPSGVAPFSPGSHTNTDTECFEATLPSPMLTVEKICVPTGDGGRFNLTVDGVVVPPADVACGGSVGPVQVSPGVAHTVGETAGTGTSLADYTTTMGGDCAADGSITLHDGDTATCTITNAHNASTARLELTKLCHPATDGGRFDLFVDTVVFTDVRCGASTGAITLPVGRHVVREASGTGTSLTDYTTVIGGACAADGAITLAAGQSATCTITNTHRAFPATVTVDKLCVPANDPGKFDLTIDGAVVKHRVGCGETTGRIHVRPGLHRVGESAAGRGEYATVTGGDCSPNGLVYVRPGHAATCLITNVRRPPRPSATLTVDKICVPEDDGGRFDLRVDGVTATDRPCGSKLGPLVLSPGVYHVAESAGSSTDAADYTTVIGGDCAPDGAITLVAGRSASCTITNIRSKPPPTGTITIVTQCVPASAKSRFDVELGEQSYSDLGCGDSTGPILVEAGTHVVGDAVTPQSDPGHYRVVYRGDCAPKGLVELRPNAHAHCTVVHIRRPLHSSPSPPTACFTLTVAPQTIAAGTPAIVVARVTARGTPVRGAGVTLAGAGISVRTVTGPGGRALFEFTPVAAGIVVATTPRQYGCPPTPSGRVVVETRTPHVTG